MTILRFVGSTERLNEGQRTAVQEIVGPVAVTLPAAGAFTSTNWCPVPLGARGVSFLLTYNAGANNGSPQFRPEWAFELMPEAQLQPHLPLVFAAAPVAAEPNGTLKSYQQMVLGPIYQLATNPNRVVHSVTVPFAAVLVRLSIAEVGVTATPGSYTLKLLFQG